jgi:hypothetical protein
MLWAYGIRELVPFRIDLAERFEKAHAAASRTSGPTQTGAPPSGMLIMVGMLVIFTLIAIGALRGKDGQPRVVGVSPTQAPARLGSCEEMSARAEKTLQAELKRGRRDGGETATLEQALAALRAKRYEEASSIVSHDPTMGQDPMLTIPLLAVDVACGTRSSPP